MPNTSLTVPMLQGPVTNMFASLGRKSCPMLDAITGTCTYTTDSLKVYIDSYRENSLAITVSTHKLLDMCIIEFTKQNKFRSKAALNRTVKIPFDRYIELRGIPPSKCSRDRARRIINNDLAVLRQIFMEWSENDNKGKATALSNIKICESAYILHGNIYFEFSEKLAKYLNNSYIMSYPLDLLITDERNPSAYHLGRKLALHSSIENNKNKSTANLLSVKKLLAVCPDIPSYEEVSRSGRQYTQRIRVPFESALNSLGFIQWGYANSKKTPLTSAQILANDYDTFSQLYVQFEIHDAQFIKPSNTNIKTLPNIVSETINAA